jgi:hypothetical protein
VLQYKLGGGGERKLECFEGVFPPDRTLLPWWDRVYGIIFLHTGADSPGDFLSASSNIQFGKSIDHYCLTITINYDYLDESTEAFQVILEKMSGLPSYVTLSGSTATVNINNMFSTYHN